jgi:signal transduction histidine kinase
MPSQSSREAVERLIQAAPGLVAEPSVDHVLQRAADLGREMLDARRGVISLLHPDHRTVASYTTSSNEPEDRPRLGHSPIGDDPAGAVIRFGIVVRLEDQAADPPSVELPAGLAPFQSLLGVPIVTRQGIQGDLYFTDKAGNGGFTEQDVHVALVLASIVASVVEHARSREQQSRLLEEIQALRRSSERFFAMVNHQLRNSLAAVYGWAEMLVRKKDPKTVPRGAIEILESAEQAVSLVNDLIDLHRLDEDRLRPNMRETDSLQVVRNALHRALAPAAEKGVRFAVPGSDAAPVTCRTDVHRAEQILVNLFSNAIRYAPAGSTVRVTVERAGATVIIAVSDDGPGVPQDAVERIFDIYYGSSSQPEGKHGVGLALSRRLARLMEGDLSAVAKPGGGLFVLTLPAGGSLSDPS